MNLADKFKLESLSLLEQHLYFFDLPLRFAIEGWLEKIGELLRVDRVLFLLYNPGNVKLEDGLGMLDPEEEGWIEKVSTFESSLHRIPGKLYTLKDMPHPQKFSDKLGIIIEDPKDGIGVDAFYIFEILDQKNNMPIMVAVALDDTSSARVFTPDEKRIFEKACFLFQIFFDQKSRYDLFLKKNETEIGQNEHFTDVSIMHLYLESVLKSLTENSKKCHLVMLQLDNFKKLRDNFPFSIVEEVVNEFSLMLLKDTQNQFFRIGRNTFVGIVEGDSATVAVYFRTLQISWMNKKINALKGFPARWPQSFSIGGCQIIPKILLDDLWTYTHAALFKAKQEKSGQIRFSKLPDKNTEIINMSLDEFLTSTVEENKNYNPEEISDDILPGLRFADDQSVLPQTDDYLQERIVVEEVNEQKKEENEHSSEIEEPPNNAPRNLSDVDEEFDISVEGAFQEFFGETDGLNDVIDASDESFSDKSKSNGEQKQGTETAEVEDIVKEKNNGDCKQIIDMEDFPEQEE